METPILYRKRIIPEECVLLKDDIILSYENDMIVTKWNALKPKKNLHHGYSCYFLNKGFKISKFYKIDNSLLYWYCDIIEWEYQTKENAYMITDLLADVIVYPNGFVKVVDLDELVTALEAGHLTMPQLKNAILSLDRLLAIIYSGEFDNFKTYIEAFE